MSPRVVAVIPTFRPDRQLLERTRLLREQVHGIVVVDDGSGSDSADLLAQLAALGATVLRLAHNRGIAAALNRGIAAAFDANADFVLTIDQDTDLEPGYVGAALGIFARANPVTRIGMVVLDAINGHPALPPWQSPEGFALVPEAIQSGSVISRAALTAVGGFDERLVIDYVDTEFCLRLRDRGFKIAVASGTNARHTLGRQAELRPFGVPLRHRDGRVATYGYHPPFRRYYITRNSIDVVLRNLRRRPRFALTTSRRELPPMVLSIVSGPERLSQLLAVTVGLVHGAIRRRGQLPPWLAAVFARERGRDAE